MMHRSLPGAEESPNLSTRRAASRLSNPTAVELLRDLREDFSLLVRQETALLREELRRKAFAMAKDCALLFGGALVVSAGVVISIMAITALLAWLFQYWGMSESAARFSAAAVTAVGTLAGGSVLAYCGMNRLKKRSLIPEESLQRLNDNKEWICRHIH